MLSLRSILRGAIMPPDTHPFRFAILRKLRLTPLGKKVDAHFSHVTLYTTPAESSLT
jgi:hypothetical protein